MSYKPDPTKNVNLTIDGIPVTVPEGTRILEAAKKVNINIPVLCEHPDLCRRAWCRLCSVECDGRGKLVVACANDVWEGVKVVTKNERLFYIRKTILELILANHPQDCLKCIRSKNCELQTLASEYGLSASSFENEAGVHKPIIENDAIVRDMDKCVKCGRCVIVCQDVQTIGAINTSYRSHEFEVSTAYKQTLDDCSCVFCGGCSKVCPVGAIYEHDQTDKVWKALGSKNTKSIAQVSVSVIDALEKEMSLEAGSITIGKLAAAVKMLGFDKVCDDSISTDTAASMITEEINSRKSAGGKKLPLISGCSEGANRFVKSFYPDLADHLTTAKTPRKIFADTMKNCCAKELNADASKVTSVSFVSSFSQKFTSNPADTDFALGVGELARMLKLAGIMIENLPEEQFFTCSQGAPKPDNSGIKKETVKGYAKARQVMEAIRKGECKADWVEIFSKPEKVD